MFPFQVPDTFPYGKYNTGKLPSIWCLEKHLWRDFTEHLLIILILQTSLCQSQPKIWTMEIIIYTNSLDPGVRCKREKREDKTDGMVRWILVIVRLNMRLLSTRRNYWCQTIIILILCIYIYIYNLSIRWTKILWRKLTNGIQTNCKFDVPYFNRQHTLI